MGFEQKKGFYRMNFSRKKIIYREFKKNMVIHYDKKNQVVAIDFYPEQKTT